MGFDPATWTAITAVGSLLAGGASVVSAFRAPKVSIPKVEIPQADIEKINQAIEANKALSDTARETVNKAIQAYSEGKLTPQYQAQLDRWWNEVSTKTAQRLSALGLQNSTMAQTAYNELSALYQENYGKLLTQQLGEALQLSGVSKEYYNELMQKAQLQLQGQIASQQSYLTAQQLAMQEKAQQAQTYGGLQNLFEGLPSNLEKLGISTTTSNNLLKLEPPKYTLPEPKLNVDFSGLSKFGNV